MEPIITIIEIKGERTMYTKARIYTMTGTIQTFALTPTSSYLAANAQAMRIRDKLRVGRIYQPHILELVK